MFSVKENNAISSISNSAFQAVAATTKAKFLQNYSLYRAQIFRDTANVAMLFQYSEKPS